MDQVPVLKRCTGDAMELEACTIKGIQKHIFKDTNPNMIFKMKANRKKPERILILYTVLDNGEVANVKVKSKSKKIKKKMMELMKTLPEFVPGKLNGKPVSVKMELPLTISI